MINFLHLKSTETQNIYFSSDWHFFHNREFVWKVRGYNSALEMTWDMVKKINEQANPNDIIFNLGDFCLNSTDGDFESVISAIKCQNIHYIWGNHNSRIKDAYADEVFRQYGRSDIEVYPLKYKNIVFVGNYLEASVNGSYLIMSHYPMDIFNKGGHGSFMLCGHSHYGYEKTRENCLDSKRLDVGWDGFKRMLSIEDIQKIMAKKKHVILDHH